jgi:hypothetical protein
LKVQRNEKFRGNLSFKKNKIYLFTLKKNYKSEL